MTRTRTRTLLTATALLALTVTATVTGCTEEDRQKAEDIVASATAAAASAAEDAQKKMDEVKEGVNATGDVKPGPTKTDGDRTVAEITATNPRDKSADYTILVNFRDSGGNLLDATVVTIEAVEPGKSKAGTARSNRTLSGDTTAEIARALRY